MNHVECHILAPDTYKSSWEQHPGWNDEPIPTRQLSVGASQLVQRYDRNPTNLVISGLHLFIPHSD